MVVVKGTGEDPWTRRGLNGRDTQNRATMAKRSGEALGVGT